MEQVDVRLLGPLHQPAPAGKYPASCYRQGNRDEKAQGRARLSTVKVWQLLSRLEDPPHTGHL